MDIETPWDKKEKLKSKLRDSTSLVTNALEDLKDYQTGRKTPIKTRFEHLNRNALGGIFPQDVIVVPGLSGHGKSYFVQQIEEDMFNKDLNPDCDKYLLIRCNWEMPVRKLIVRKISRDLNLPISEIYNREFTDEEQEIVGSIVKQEQNPNLLYFEQPTTADEWIETIEKVLSENTTKKQILITIDHIALVLDQGNKKKAIDRLAEGINIFKKKYPNCSFIILTQLNRDIEGRRDISEATPRTGDVYMSSTLQHLCDLMVCVHNPYKLGFDKIMVTQGFDRPYAPQYHYLKEWMTTPEKKNTNFKTKGVIFYFYLKLRDADDPQNLRDVHISYLDGFKTTKEELPPPVDFGNGTVATAVEDNSDLDAIGNSLYLDEGEEVEDDLPF